MVVGQRRRVQTTRSFLASASAAVPSCASASSRLVPRLPSPTLPPPLPVQWFGARPPTPFRVRPTRVVAGKGAYMQCPAQHTERCGLARPDGGEDSVWARRQTCCCKRTDRVTPDRLMTRGLRPPYRWRAPACRIRSDPPRIQSDSESGARCQVALPAASDPVGDSEAARSALTNGERGQASHIRPPSLRWPSPHPPPPREPNVPAAAAAAAAGLAERRGGPVGQRQRRWSRQSSPNKAKRFPAARGPPRGRPVLSVDLWSQPPPTVLSS